MKAWHRALAIVVAATAFGAASCSDDATLGGNASQGGSVVVAEAEPPNSLDPALASTPAALRAAWLAYTPPLTYRRVEGSSGTDLVPALAEELPEVSDDGRTYTFAFRPGLRYANGQPLRASDFERAVARSLRLAPAATDLFGDIVGARAYARSRERGADIAGIAVNEGQRLVRIELDTPDRLFPYALASLRAAPVPGGTALSELTARPPAGIGPYSVAQVRRSGDVLLVRRPDWDIPAVPEGNPQQIVTRTIPGLAERVRAVRAGRADLVEGESPVRLLADIRSEPGDSYEEHRTLRSL